MAGCGGGFDVLRPACATLGKAVRFRQPDLIGTRAVYTRSDSPDSLLSRLAGACCNAASSRFLPRNPIAPLAAIRVS